MLVTDRKIVCAKCRRSITNKREKSRLFVETDNKGQLRVVCNNCR